MLLPTGQRNATLAPLPTFSRLTSADDEWAVAQIQQRHLLQVGFVDRVVGRLIARLKKVGIYDRALLIVTADHGVALARGHHVRRFATETAGAIMRIPLIIKLPSRVNTAALFLTINERGQRVSDQNVETVDIAPTIAGALGVPLPWRIDGTSVLAASTGSRRRKRVYDAGATASREFGPEGPPADAVIDGGAQGPATTSRDSSPRFDIVGDRNRHYLLRSPRFHELVGLRLADVHVSETSRAGELAFRWMYTNVDPSADAMPFDVSGRLFDDAPRSKPVFVAVAVNGTISAVTRTWPRRSGRWLATPPLDVWRRGDNWVDVFVIQTSGGRPVLERVRIQTSRPDDLNLISEAAAVYWRVQQRGFSTHERTGDRPFRWTDGNASLAVPLHGKKAVAIRLKIRLQSDARRGARDRRRLGVAVRHIVLQTD